MALINYIKMTSIKGIGDILELIREKIICIAVGGETLCVTYSNVKYWLDQGDNENEYPLGEFLGDVTNHMDNEGIKGNIIFER